MPRARSAAVGDDDADDDADDHDSDDDGEEEEEEEEEESVKKKGVGKAKAQDKTGMKTGKAGRGKKEGWRKKLWKNINLKEYIADAQVGCVRERQWE